jgi:hypothetical protein
LERNYSKFNNPNCLNVLYFSLIISILEFGLVIWNPFQIELQNNLEKIQRRFLRMIAHKVSMAGGNKKKIKKLKKLL